MNKKYGLHNIRLCSLRLSNMYGIKKMFYMFLSISKFI